ncbi:hypothetical protein CPB86DRAFT_715044 [Serendipita vermifera]|nr:hypothetical protein CPB86DRAFT_715044 [Serendipita vermifera]
MSRSNPVLRPRYPPSSSSQLQDTAEQSLSMQAPVDPDESMPAASDFVRKLFRMLEDPAYSSIVCWGSQRDCFIVKDMTEFTKVILPRLFKHSNFASFVKNTDENAYGEHCWTFRHPKFRADQLEGLEDIKRKSAPTRRGSTRPNQPARSKSPPDSQLHHDMGESSLVSSLQDQIDQLLQSQRDMKSHIFTLETNYRSVLDELAAFQRGMASQDALIQSLLQHLVNFEQRTSATSSPPGNPVNSLESTFVSEEAQRLMSSAAYSQQDVARASLQQLTELSRRANRTMATSNISPTVNLGPQTTPNDRIENLPRLQTSPDAPVLSVNPQQQQPPQQITSPSQVIPTQSPLDWSSHKGLQVLTVGHLLPRNATTPSTPNPQEDMEVEEQVMPSSSYSQPQPPTSTKLRVRRKTYVPGWAVPPRVLLVEDDAVSRKLSSKFLQVLGVTADVAVDGDAAVKQMCLERYDLVLMDIVMPRLDGVAATSLIRQFDHRTPIISMTSNSCPQDILNYYSHGMNDILPKPFTRDGLFSMLEKHLMHLKAMSQLSQIPRSITDDSTDQMKEIANSVQQFKSDEAIRSGPPSASSAPFAVNGFMAPGQPVSFGSINPIAGLGVGDEQQYASMLATMTGDLFSDPTSRTIGIKRSAQDNPDADLIDEHPAKRSRFETIE